MAQNAFFHSYNLSGSCVAGVVDKKMPRYCVLGQSVSIANKLEAAGAGKSPSFGFQNKPRIKLEAKAVDDLSL